MEERRKYPRFQPRFPVSFKSDNITGDGLVLNLSKEGCLIESDTATTEGQYLDMSITLPDRESPLRIESAAVRFRQGRFFGIQFLYMQQAALDRLEGFIEILLGRKRPCN